MNKATEIANRLLEQQGYLIMSWHAGPKPAPQVGDVWRGDIPVANGPDLGKVPGPVRIIGMATVEELQRQHQLAGKMPRAMPDTVVALFKVVAE